MELSNTAAASSSSSSVGVSPADLAPGLEVDVESRTWAGINKPGGHATVIKIHIDEESGAPDRVDVRYVLGGRETNVELAYVRTHVELARGGRRRRRNVKMNLESFGGVENNNKGTRGRKQATGNGGGARKKKEAPTSPAKGKKGNGAKKRKALASLDGNGGTKKAKAAKKSIWNWKPEEESSKKEDKAREEPSEKDLANAIAEDGEWTLIQDGKVADYTSALEKGRRISYWWSEEDGWLPGIVSKSLVKVVTPSTIKWTVRVDFDNGDRHVLTFHPLEKRWRVHRNSTGVEEENEPKAKEPKAKEPTKKETVSAKGCASKKSTEPAGEKEDEERASVMTTNEPKEQPSLMAKKPTCTKSYPVAAAAIERKKGTSLVSKKTAIEKSASAAAEPKKMPSLAAKKHASEKSADAAENYKGAEKIPREDDEKLRAAATKTTAGARSSSSSAPRKSISLSSGPRPQSKIREASSRIMHGAASSAPKEASTFSMSCIGRGSSLPRGTLSPDKDRRRLPQDVEDGAARRAAARPSPIRPPPPSAGAARDAEKKAKLIGVKKSKGTTEHMTGNRETEMLANKFKGSMEYAESLKKTSSSGSRRTVMQSLYRSECGKAEKFVDFMTGGPSRAANDEEKGASAVPLSLSREMDEDDDLELKMDQGRMVLFNSILTEIMFRQRLDTMDVGEMMEKLNENARRRRSVADSSDERPFTLLEVKPYLQKLHDESRIFLVEEEGTMGVIYAI